MEITLTFAILSTVTIGIVEVIKRIGLPVKYAPLVALFSGIIFCWLAGVAMPQLIFVGLAVGLSASGLYDVGKKTILSK